MAEIKVPASLEGASTLKDGSLSLRFYTQELTAEEKTAVFSLVQQFGWLVFAPQERNTDEIELEAIRKDTGGKTPSQRLRAVIYVAYQQSGQDDKTFEQFYAQKMEQLISHFKSRLDN